MPRPLDAATRTRRLLALIPHLRKGDRVPLADMARAVGCSVDEVTDDLTTLMMCGVPPFTPLDLVGIDIDGDHVTVYLDPPGLEHPLRLTGTEARALVAALDMAGYAPDAPLRASLARICSGSVSLEELERTVRTGAAPGGAADTYATLAAAAEAREKLRITYYTGASGTLSERVVHPWTLVQRLGAWYLTAWCESARGERVFRLDRIRSVERTGLTFTRPDMTAMAVTPDAADLRVAEIRFAPGVRLPDERRWPGTTLEREADGSTLARVPFQSPSWIARRIVAYLGSAEVLGPEDVRAAVRGLAEDLLHAAR